MREQIEVSRAEFWQAIQSGEPVERPVKTDDELAVEHEPWVIPVLVGELQMAPEEIEKLTDQDAIDLVHKHWSGERS